MTTPPCPICGGSMKLTVNAYSRGWACARQDGLSPCPGFVQIEEDEALTSVQLAQYLSERQALPGATEAPEQATYRLVKAPLEAMSVAPYLSRADQDTLKAALRILASLNEAAWLAGEPAELRKEQRREASDQRHRAALAVLGRTSPQPLDPEGSMTDLLALDAVAGAGLFASYHTSATFTVAILAECSDGQPPTDVLIRALFRYWGEVVSLIAREWVACDTPLEELDARLTVALETSRQRVLADPPAPLAAVRTLLQPDPRVTPFRRCAA